MKRIAGWMVGLCLMVVFLGAFAPKASSEGKVGAEMVWVKRTANAASCEGEGEPLAVARKALEKAGVRVLQEKRASDGMMHVQMCGADTGALNSFQISKSELEKAKVAGFSESR